MDKGGASMKVLNFKRVLLSFVLLAVVTGCASTQLPVVEEPPKELTHETWSDLVPVEKIAIVLFDSTGTSWLTNEYEQLKELALADVSFLDYQFIEKSKDANLAPKKPAIHLYRDGFLIDRITGSPDSYFEVVNFERDIKLWVDTTIQSLRYQTIENVLYKFNGSYTLDIRAY